MFKKKPRIHQYLKTKFIIDGSVNSLLENDIKDFIAAFSTFTELRNTIVFEYIENMGKRVKKLDKGVWESIFASTYRNKKENNTYLVLISSNEGLLVNLYFISRALANILMYKKKELLTIEDKDFKDKLERLYISNVSTAMLFGARRISIDSPYENFHQDIVQASCGFNSEPVDKVIDDLERYIAYLAGINGTTDNIILVGYDKTLITKIESNLKYMFNKLTLSMEIANKEVNSYKLIRNMLDFMWSNPGYEIDATANEIDIPDIFFGGEDI